jgi:hypothetical protein
MDKKEFIREFGYYNEGWTVQNGVFVCPCDKRIEPDGSCPEGHESPFLQENIL